MNQQHSAAPPEHFPPPLPWIWRRVGNAPAFPPVLSGEVFIPHQQQGFPVLLRQAVDEGRIRVSKFLGDIFLFCPGGFCHQAGYRLIGSLPVVVYDRVFAIRKSPALPSPAPAVAEACLRGFGKTSWSRSLCHRVFNLCGGYTVPGCCEPGLPSVRLLT